MSCACNSQITCNYCRINGVRMRTVHEKVLVVDIDGTLTNGEYPYTESTPRQDVIDKVNKLFDSGWKIILLTARGQNTFSCDLVKIEEAYRELTAMWLMRHGVNYHILSFKKPAAVYYVDDKALRPEEFCSKEF